MHTAAIYCTSTRGSALEKMFTALDLEHDTVCPTEGVDPSTGERRTSTCTLVVFEYDKTHA